MVATASRALGEAATGSHSPATQGEYGRTAPIGLLVLIVLGGALLRFAGLGSESIWLDEVTSILIARMDVPSMVAWTAADIHPPLYYFVLHFWLGFGESEFAVRSLSAVFGVCTIVIVYALARELFDPGVGLLSALLLALSPMHIWYSQEARMYAMVTALSLMASYLLVLALRTRKTRYWLGYLLFSVLALYTHYFALFVLLFQNLFIVLWLWRHKAERHLWRRWLLIELGVGLLFLPWVPVIYRQVSGGGGVWVEKSIGRPDVRALLDTWLHFSVGLERQLYPEALRRLAYLLYAVSIVTVAVHLLPVSARRWLTRRAVAISEWDTTTARTGLWFCVLYVAVPLLVAWLVSQVKPMYTERYLLPFVPPYCIVVAYGLSAIGPPTAIAFGETRVPGGTDAARLWRWLRLAIILCLVVTLLVGNWNAWRIPQRADWRWASSYVLDRAQPGDVVLFLPRWLAKPFDYYARGRIVLSMDLVAPITEQAAQDVATDMARHYQRAWLFWQSDHYSDPGGIVQQVLNSRFTLVQAVDFQGVGRLILYDLTATRTGLN